MKGFTLLETMVAISVLIVGILGPLSMATYTISRSSLSENEIVAYNLAEEGLEFVINTRDSNVFRSGSNAWLDGLDDDDGPGLINNQCDGSNGGNNGCAIDVTNTVDPVKECANSSSCTIGGVVRDLIRRNSTSGLYTHNVADTATIFKRRVYVLGNNDDYASGSNVDLNNGDENVVQVVVTWSEKFAPNKSITIEHHIFQRE
jgi:type II secretory pathway pseudopilin PulG